MVRLIFSSILAVFCSTAAAQAGTLDAQSDRSQLQSLYDEAQRLQRAGNLDQAATQYREFLAEALRELANSRAQIGDSSRAASLYDEALALAPSSPSVRRDYAITAFQAGDLKHAETLARGLLDEYPSDPKGLAKAHQILGRTLLKMSQDQKARMELEAAVALDPSFQNKYDLALVCLDLDDEKCAVQIFDGIEASAGDSPALHMQFGRAYGNSDFTPRGVTEFKKVIAEDPHYPGAHYCVAATLLETSENEQTLQEAEAELKEELAVSPNDFLTYAALGKVEAGRHKNREAEQYLKHAVVLNPKNPDAFLYLGQMYFDTNRMPEAEANLRSAIKLTTDISRNHFQIQKAHFLLGRILMQKHEQEKAHAEMQLAHAVEDKALSMDRRRLTGILSDSAAATDPSISRVAPTADFSATLPAVDHTAVSTQRAFEKQLTPAIADTYNNLGAIMGTGKNYADALNYFQHAAAWSPSLEGLDLNLGRAAFMSAKFSEAVAPLSRYLRSHPGDLGLRGPLAMSEFMTNNYRACIDALKGAGEEVTSIPQIQYIYAESLVKTGEASLGKAHLESLESAHPEIAEVHRGIGEVLELQGNMEKASEELRTAVLLNANDPESHYDLGKIDLEIGDATTAIPELEAAVRLQPDDSEYHRELAGAYKLALRPADADNEIRIYDTLGASQQQPANGGIEPAKANAPDR